MLYKSLTKDEIKQVETTINHLLGSRVMSNILKRKKLIKIIGRRDDVYLILKSDLALFEKISSLELKKELKMVHARIKLGFFIHMKFLIGIESLAFLAPLTKIKLHLDQHNTQKFIYGRDIDSVSLKDQITNLKENTDIIVFSPDNIPLGYARVFFKDKKMWLQNLIDVGIFLRSEKSAF